ncbi:MAG TPA: NAD-dependent protein deacylase [Victivallales bacterium]|nr:NAD-dependent protein deacylase [Victivallales bacterium]
MQDKHILDIIDKTAEAVLNADKILVITGAGISAGSGLPTYRGIGGLYDDNNTTEGIPIEDALSGMMMQSRPDITWKYLWQIGSSCLNAKPNRAHIILSEIQKIKPDTWILTQNIDGLHAAAGNNNLIEIHGNAFKLFCPNCGYKPDYSILTKKIDNRGPKLPPICPECENIIRPEVVLFGEQLPEKEISRLYTLLQNNNIDLILCIGTSALFPYISEPVVRAYNHGKITVEINPEKTYISDYFTYSLRLEAVEALSSIWNSINTQT